jgi:hypothetical protein
MKERLKLTQSIPKVLNITMVWAIVLAAVWSF